MKCPECRGNGRTIETAERLEGAVRRRRRCEACGHRWTTVEVPLASRSKGGRPRKVTPAQAMARQRVAAFVQKLEGRS